MSLYTRNRRPSFGLREKGRISGKEGLSFAIKDNPLSTFYIAPFRGASTKSVVTYLISIQTRQYGCHINIPEAATKAHAKAALKEHSPEYVARAIKYASTISQHPYSIPFALKVFADVGKQFDRPRSDTQPNNSAAGLSALWD